MTNEWSAREPTATLPMVGICVSVSISKQYCWPLLGESIARFDYPRERIHLHLLVEEFSQEVEASRTIPAFVHDRLRGYASVKLELGAQVEWALRRKDALVNFSPPNFRSIVHLTRLRQRMLEHFLLDCRPPVDYVYFLDADTVWPANSLRRLVETSERRAAPAVGLLPYRHPEKHLLAFWFPHPPHGRLLAYNPEDIPRQNFAVDFATMGGTLIPRSYLEAFQSRGGWYPYPATDYLNRGMGDDVYFFLGSGERVPLWVDPEVRGWHVEQDGWAQRFGWNSGSGEAEIVERRLSLQQWEHLTLPGESAF